MEYVLAQPGIATDGNTGFGKEPVVTETALPGRPVLQRQLRQRDLK